MKVEGYSYVKNDCSEELMFEESQIVCRSDGMGGFTSDEANWKQTALLGIIWVK